MGNASLYSLGAVAHVLMGGYLSTLVIAERIWVQRRSLHTEPILRLGISHRYIVDSIIITR
jgi:hypothetical protein